MSTASDAENSRYLSTFAGLNSGRLDHVPTDLVERVAPALSAHLRRVAEHPGVQAYYAQFASR